jgi:hypothetical protein
MWFRKSIDELLECDSPYNAVSGLIGRIQKKKNLSDLTNAEQMLRCLNVLFSESENGTLEQYAANSSGDLFNDTLRHLETINATAACEALSNLNALLNGKMHLPRKSRLEEISMMRSRDEQGFEARIRELTDALDWDKIFSSAVIYLRQNKQELT